MTNSHGTKSICPRFAVHVSFVELVTSRGNTCLANAADGINFLINATGLDENMKQQARHGSNLSLLVFGAATHSLSANEQTLGTKSNIITASTKI
jgi:hypothetical protein